MKDERKYKENIKQKPIPPTYPSLRAYAKKWPSQLLIYEDMLKQKQEERKSSKNKGKNWKNKIAL